MNPLLDALGDVGYVMDTPGAYLRGLLGGAAGARMSGQDLLSSYGVDGGMLGGTATEMVTDPLALAPLAYGAYKGIRGLTGGARALAGAFDNPLERRLAELGAGVETPMDAVRFASQRGESDNPLLRGLAGFVGDEEGALRPFQEIGRRTDPDYLNSREWFHGNATPGLTADSLDAMKTSPDGLVGRGFYQTEDPFIAGEYADTRIRDALFDWRDDSGKLIRPAYLRDPVAVNGAASELASSLSANPHFSWEGRDLQSAVSRDVYPGHPTSGVPNAISALIHRASGGHEAGTAAIPDIAAIMGRHGIQLPPAPQQSVYRATAGVSNVLDADLPPQPRLIDAIRAMADEVTPQYRADNPFLGPAAMPGSQLDSLLAQPDVTNMDLIQALNPAAFMDDTGQMIRALRQAGYDAITHTGGQRVGLGKNPLHQVLVTLDPNDRVSRVGRPGGITGLEQLPPDVVRQLTGWKG